MLWFTQCQGKPTPTVYRRRRDSIPTTSEQAVAYASGAGGSLVVELIDLPDALEPAEVSAALASGELRNPLRFLGEFSEAGIDQSADFAGGSLVSTIRPGAPQTEPAQVAAVTLPGALIRQVRDASAPTTESLTADAAFAGGSKV